MWLVVFESDLIASGKHANCFSKVLLHQSLQLGSTINARMGFLLRSPLSPAPSRLRPSLHARSLMGNLDISSPSISLSTSLSIATRSLPPSCCPSGLPPKSVSRSPTHPESLTKKPPLDPAHPHSLLTGKLDRPFPLRLSSSGVPSLLRLRPGMDR